MDDRTEMINVQVLSALLHFTGLQYLTGTVRESISIHFAQEKQKVRSTIISMELIKTKNLNKYKTKIY